MNNVFCLDKEIQDLVDARKGSDINQFAAETIIATSVSDGSGTRFHAYQAGFNKAVGLMNKFQYALDMHKGSKATFKIYVATQDTSDGTDYFYFIGTKNDVITALKGILAIRNGRPAFTLKP